MSGVLFPKRVRSLFLSDLHLGYWVSRGENSRQLLDECDAEITYLVGDIIDESRLKLNWHWPAAHQELVDKVLWLAKSKQVFAVPGNHDEFLRQSPPLDINSDHETLGKLLTAMFEIPHAEYFDHCLADGRRLLVTHGDRFDDLDESLIGIPKIGSRIFDQFNWLLPRPVVNGLRSFFKLLLARPRRIEERLIKYAIENGYDGVVFGHLHEPKLFDREGFIVANCGDWMVNQSFLVETLDGDLELYNFGKCVAKYRGIR